MVMTATRNLVLTVTVVFLLALGHALILAL